MKKKLGILCCTLMAVFLAMGATEVKAAKADDEWNYKSKLKVTKGAFTYYAMTSLDETEVWIYELKINRKKEHSTLSIPQKLENKKVTRLGYSVEKDLGNDESFDKNIFGTYASLYYQEDGGEGITEGIHKIVIPQSVEVIGPSTFSGANSITSIKIPSKVKEIGELCFYGCDKLQTIKFPAGLEKLSTLAIVDCPKLNKVKFSKNNLYEVKGGCVINKEEKSLVAVLPKKGTLKVPKGVKILKQYSFSNCTSSKVEIPASVNYIEKEAFWKNGPMKSIKDVIVSKKNKVYEKDGQCIYNKTDKTLSVAIPNDKGVLYVSNKITSITDEYSMVNVDNFYGRKLNKVVLPKRLKYLTEKALYPLARAEKIYFTGENPPKFTGEIDIESYIPFPVDGKVYVPKASYKAYKKWYKEYDYGYKKIYKF